MLRDALLHLALVRTRPSERLGWTAGHCVIGCLRSCMRYGRSAASSIIDHQSLLLVDASCWQLLERVPVASLQATPLNAGLMLIVEQG